MHLLAPLLCCLIATMVDEVPKNAELSAIVADSATWPDELKTKFQALSEDHQHYCVMMLAKVWPVAAPLDGLTCVLTDPVTVTQIVSDNAFIGQYRGDSFWIEGINTSSLADDDRVRTEGFAFKADGNHRYTTVIGGSKTVQKLRAFDVSEATDLVQSVLMRRGFRLFQVERFEDHPWIIAHVSAISKTSATLRFEGERKSFKLSGDHFTAADREWLNDKKNLAAMKQAKKDWDAANREKPEAE